MNLKDIDEGMYIQIYTDNDIYQVYSSYGNLYINFRGEERTLESFGKLLYKVYTFEEIENIGARILKESGE
ncbi:MAG: hypothetical protein UHK60_11030 [Acutalibacteraceae bacterium]|nr:hypothetical protein [Acutalibacteraceae bacterium]